MCRFSGQTQPGDVITGLGGRFRRPFHRVIHRFCERPGKTLLPPLVAQLSWESLKVPAPMTPGPCPGVPARLGAPERGTPPAPGIQSNRTRPDPSRPTRCDPPGVDSHADRASNTRAGAAVNFAHTVWHRADRSALPSAGIRGGKAGAASPGRLVRGSACSPNRPAPVWLCTNPTVLSLDDRQAPWLSHWLSK